VLRLVDTSEVETGLVDRFLSLVRDLAVPVMTDAGAELVSCAAAPPGLGEPVCVEVVWEVADFETWNGIRRALVLDPRWYEYGSAASALRSGGRRRFVVPVPWSPRPAPAPPAG